MAAKDFVSDLVFLGIFFLATIAMAVLAFLTLKKLRDPREGAKVAREFHERLVRTGVESPLGPPWTAKQLEPSVRFVMCATTLVALATVFVIVVLYLNYKQIIK